MMCCAVFVGVGYFYLEQNFKAAQNQVENVPYTQQAPESAGLLFEVNGEKAFIYLDFENEIITVSLSPETAIDDMIYGYPLDYTVIADEAILTNSIDYIDGIDLETDNGIFRHTGAQVSKLLQTDNSRDFKQTLFEKICQKISVSGVGVDFFAEIIENSSTDLKLPDCYFWADNFDRLCKNLRFID